ncbi:MAG: hypothetical protein IJ062_06680 [Firmicutes bacterium]|nr:hypothetical protein [Bacillota bacterium]
MANTLASFKKATITNVEIINKDETNYNFHREDYTGFTGELTLFYSEDKYPGEIYAYICGEDDDLKTSCGTIKTDGDTVALTTRNTVYTFKIIEE